RLGGHQDPEGGPADIRDPHHRPHRSRAGDRPGQGGRGGVRRLPREAVRTPPRRRRGRTVHRCRTKGRGLSDSEVAEVERPARILVVDDHPDNVEIINVRLSSRGYEIETASNGEEALGQVRESPPDLILLDVMMPLMDGYEVSRRIKNDPALPFIPIILVTARDSTQDKVEGLDAGADDYLTKPVNFAELEARV